MFGLIKTNVKKNFVTIGMQAASQLIVRSVKLEFCRTFSVLVGVALLETGCAGHRAVQAARPTPVAPVDSVAKAPLPAVTNVSVASGMTTAMSERPPGTIVASAAPMAVENVITASPPPPQVEVVGEAPGPEFVWMPGIWTWQGNWVWISGRWVLRPRPDARWVSGHWTEHRNGWVWVRGYWR